MRWKVGRDIREQIFEKRVGACKKNSGVELRLNLPQLRSRIELASLFSVWFLVDKLEDETA